MKRKVEIATGLDPAWASELRKVGKKWKARRTLPVAVTGPSGRQTVPRTMGVWAQTERKYFDSYVNGSALTASTDWTGTEHDPTANSLFTPTEGSDIDNRVGRLVHVHKIQIRGIVHFAAQTNQTALDPACVVRGILVMDMQTNGAQMQGEQLMAAPGAASAQLCVSTMQNAANFGRFRVLKDKTFVLQDPAATYDGTNIEVNGLSKPFKWTIKFQKPVAVRFNATNGGTIADVIDNSFHMIWNSTSTAFAQAISYQARFVYTDK